MKQLFNSGIDATKANIALLFLRIAVASFMLTHGLPKLMMLLSGEINFLPVMGMGPGMSLGLVVFAEVFCSLLILLGLATRLATLPLIITMLVAVFYVHVDDPFGKMEVALLYLSSYFTLLIAGGGKFSFDYLVQRWAAAPAKEQVASHGTVIV